MLRLPEKIIQLISLFTKLPGVGEKTATRYALFLARCSSEDLGLFGKVLENLSQLKTCEECGLYADTELCLVCLQSSRYTAKILCVVEDITDAIAIESSENFHGLYHVLGGVLNPLAGIGPQHLFINKLVERIKKHEITDIILAVNPSVEGDATCSFLKEILGSKVSIHRIGFGIPMGGNLEYLDPLTISKALENKKPL